MDRKTVDIRDHALYNIGYDQYGRYVDGGVNLRKESVSMAAGAEEAAADMNVMPGEMEVSANIKIVFSMGE